MQRFAVLLVVALFGCQPQEAKRIELSVVTDGHGLEASDTALGWTVEFSQARLAIRDLEFTTAGELHGARKPSTAAWLLGLILPEAHAHPGHYQGGEVIGELPGKFLLDFVDGDGQQLGLATLLVGSYTAANFSFRRATADELAPDDPLISHTAILSGSASKDGQTVEFSILIDSPEDRQLVGAPFEAELDESSDVVLGVQWLGTNPYEGKHLFDEIDFAALDAADGSADSTFMLVDPETSQDVPAELVDAYNNIRRDFQTHDLFRVVTRDP